MKHIILTLFGVILLSAQESQGKSGYLQIANNNLNVDIGLEGKFFLWSLQFSHSVYEEQLFLISEFSMRFLSREILLKQSETLYYKVRETRNWLGFGIEYIPQIEFIHPFVNMSYLYSWANYKGFSKDQNDVWKPMAKIGLLFGSTKEITPLFRIYIQYSDINNTEDLKYFISISIPLEGNE